MLESLSQVGANCHKVQNVLVSWGVCSLFPMPQPPWGEGKQQLSGFENSGRVEGCFLFFFHVHRPTHTDPRTLYTARTHVSYSTASLSTALCSETHVF